MELQGRSRFAKLYLEFMKVERGSVVLTLICEYTHHQEEVYIYIYICIYIYVYIYIYIYVYISRFPIQVERSEAPGGGIILLWLGLRISEGRW